MSFKYLVVVCVCQASDSNEYGNSDITDGLFARKLTRKEKRHQAELQRMAAAQEEEAESREAETVRARAEAAARARADIVAGDLQLEAFRATEEQVAVPGEDWRFESVHGIPSPPEGVSLEVYFSLYPSQRVDFSGNWAIRETAVAAARQAARKKAAEADAVERSLQRELDRRELQGLYPREDLSFSRVHHIPPAPAGYSSLEEYFHQQLFPPADAPAQAIYLAERALEGPAMVAGQVSYRMTMELRRIYYEEDEGYRTFSQVHGNIPTNRAGVDLRDHFRLHFLLQQLRDPEYDASQ